MNRKPRPTSVEKIHEDAEPQFVQSKKGSTNDGVTSAKPTVITHSDDATAHNRPDGRPRGRYWHANSENE